ncbi:MAG: hypothetical protein IT385_15820 [Deltaproteobacteria bacterium]|nr:hypothetical protein [Deltaproteobacteria bacterium]
MTRSVLVTLGLTLALAAPSSRAEELVIGVYLPQAPFATNTERAAWADRLAADLTAKAGGAFTARAQVFARKEDVGAFAGKVDLLVLDGLYAVERGGDVVGHAGPSPAVALYAAAGASVGDLAGKDVAIPESGAGDINFFANTALGGELAPEPFFGEIKRTKDAASALGAVKAGSASGAFAPVGHPAAAGLKALAQGGSYPVAVLVVANKARVDPVRPALTTALAGGAGGGGGLGAIVPGGGEAFGAARGLKVSPRVLTSPALLTGGVDAKPVAPPIRLRTRGAVPPPVVDAGALVRPTLTEPPL